MKKLFLLGLAVLLFAACQQQEKKRYFSESPEIEAIKANVTEYNNGDWETWRTHFADTAKLYINSLKSISASDLENAQKELLSNFSSYGFQDEGTFIEMVIDNDDETWVNYWANWHAKFKANGKEVDVPVHFTAQFVDGKIVEFHDYFDVSALNNEIAALSNMSDLEKKITTKINNLAKAWSTNDAELFAANTSKNLVRYDNGVKSINNQAEYLANISGYHAAFPDLNIALDELSVEGNKGMGKWTATGTNTGEFMGKPPTGKKIKFHGVAIWKFNNDGLGVHEEVYSDPNASAMQLGYTLTAPK